MSVSTPTYIYPPFNADSGALYQQFTAFMQANIPGWVPYSGELDDWLARIFTSIEATNAELASDVTTSIFRYFGANIVNVPPFAAVAATSVVTITVQDANGPYTIPAFTPMSFPDANGQLQGFETTADVIIPNGQTQATGVFVLASTPGIAENGCTGAGDLDGSTPITFITGLEMTSLSSGGLEAEADADYLTRLTAVFTTLTPSPITISDFTILAATQEGVARAVTQASFNPAGWAISGTLVSTSKSVTVSTTANIPVGASVTGTDIPSNTYVTGITSGTVFTISNAASGSTTTSLTIGGALNQPGFVTSWVMGPTDVLSSPAMAAVQAAIQAECLLGVTYAVEAPTENTINVTIVGLSWPGAVIADTEAAVQAALTNFLEPQNFGANTNPAPGQNSLGWVNDNQVRLSVIENVCMNVPGVHDITSVQINSAAANFPLVGIVPITEPGTISVTLTSG